MCLERENNGKEKEGERMGELEQKEGESSERGGGRDTQMERKNRERREWKTILFHLDLGENEFLRSAAGRSNFFGDFGGIFW